MHHGTGKCAEARLQVAELEEAWEACSDLFINATSVELEPSEKRLLEEIVFCIIGGFGVAFEHALSVTDLVLQLGLHHPVWDDVALEARLEAEFRRPQFEPRGVAGGLRRYRYPHRKASLIVHARRWFIDQRGVVSRLQAIECERQRRAVLMSCPGLGPKSASWALRNTGLASDLAILDVHIMRALRLADRITIEVLPRDYDAVEESFVRWCRDLGAPAAAFDLFLWEWQRGSLRL